MGPKKEEDQGLREVLEKEVEEADEESFPASDPPAWTLGVDPKELRADADETPGD